MTYQHGDDREFAYVCDLYDKNIGSREFFNEVEKHLPPVFSRQTASKAIGGLISPKTMANADSLGQGPSERV